MERCGEDDSCLAACCSFRALPIREAFRCEDAGVAAVPTLEIPSTCVQTGLLKGLAARTCFGFAFRFTFRSEVTPSRSWSPLGLSDRLLRLPI